MRWYIIRVLVAKEGLRYLANRGTLLLAVLLAVLMVLLSLFSRYQAAGPTTNLIGGVQLCYVDYWRDGPWVRFLRRNVAPELRQQIRFRYLGDHEGLITYPQNTGAIQLRPEGDGYKVWFWHPGEDAGALAPFESWFWRETRRFAQEQAVAELNRRRAGAGDALVSPDLDDPAWMRAEAFQRFRDQLAAAWEELSPGDAPPAVLPPFYPVYSRLTGAPDLTTTLAAMFLLAPLWILCVYLVPSLTCEERERGVLLAQALSPASPGEILAAKFLFYVVTGTVLGGLLGGLFNPRVLLTPFFWLAVVVTTLGLAGVGLSFASFGRTQRTASMAAMSYMIVVALFLLVCQQYRIPFLPYLALEYHCPRMLQAALAGQVARYHWGSLGGAAILAGVWAYAAVVLFQRRGWQ